MERRRLAPIEQLPLINSAKNRARKSFIWAIPAGIGSTSLFDRGENTWGTIFAGSALGLAFQSFGKYCEYRRRNRVLNKDFSINATRRINTPNIKVLPNYSASASVPIEGTEAS